MENKCFIHYDVDGQCNDPVFATQRTITTILSAKERT